MRGVILLLVACFFDEYHTRRVQHGDGRQQDWFQDQDRSKETDLSNSFGALSRLFLAFNPSLPSRHNILESTVPIHSLNHVGHRQIDPSMQEGSFSIRNLLQLPRGVDGKMAKLCVDNFILPSDADPRSVSKAAYKAVQRDIIGLKDGKDAFVAIGDGGEFAGMITVNEEQLGIATGCSKLQGKTGAFLANLVVKDKYRKQGIGKALCRKVEAKAESMGFDDIYLCVEKDNTPAIKFYNKIGYRQFDINTEAKRPKIITNGLEFVPTTQLIMRKDLKNPPPSDTPPLAPIALGAVGLLAAGYIATGGFAQ
jgi:ribosomal protein S18 acetylase RimI-like enzyme